MFKALLRKQLKETALIYTTGGGRTEIKKQKKNKKADSAVQKAPAKKKHSGVWFALLYILVILSMAMAFLGVSEALSGVLLGSAEDCEWLYFALIFVMAIAFGMIGSVFSVYTSIYKSKDNELLLSMPIKPWMIVCVRMLSCWIISLVCIATGFVPAMLKYGQFRSVSAVNIIVWIFLIIICSLFCMALTCLLGWIVALISGKVKNKSFITVLITVVLLGGYYVFYFNANNLLSQLVANALTVGVAIKKNVYLLYAAGRAFCADVPDLLIFSAVSITAFALVYLLISKSFIRLTTSSSGEKKKAYNIRSAEQNSIKKCLLKREFRHFLSSASYMLNCGIGVLFAAAIMVIVIIKRNDIAELLSLLELMAPEYKGYLPLVFGMICCFLTGSNDITSPSISIEGENFWILRSMPVDMNEVIKAKIKMQIYINAVVAAALIAVYFIMFDMSISGAVLCALFAAVNVYFQAAAGIAVNIKMPKFDWVNETSCVKQSGSVVIVLFGAWLLIAAEGLIYWFLCRNFMTPVVFTIILTVITAAADVVIALWLKNKGSKILDSL